MTEGEGECFVSEGERERERARVCAVERELASALKFQRVEDKVCVDERERKGWIDKMTNTNKHKDRQRETHTSRIRHTYIQTGRDTDRKTYRQRQRKTDT